MPPRRLVGLLTLTAVTATSTAACGIVTPPAVEVPKRAVRAADAGVEPAISPAESQRVLSGYTTRQNRAALSGDGTAWRGGLTGPLEATAGTALRVNGGRPPEQGQITLLAPVLHVPRLSGFPKWFSATATEQRSGVPGRKSRVVLLVFVRRDARSRWQAAHRLYLPARTKAPRPATDDQGYVAVPGRDDRLAVAPQRLADLHSQYLSSGIPTKLFGPGPATSGRRRAVQQAKAAARAGGWRTAFTVVAGEYPAYVLRAAAGGALVWYALDETETLTGAPPESVPVDVRTLLAGRTGQEVRIRRLRLVYAHVQAKGGVQVLATTAGLVGATVR
jgi:hypothetical protein